ncbi:MAG TPA: peptide-methionine (S)-S-oxide reductase MsrA [Tepidisphaeraceae bacterium]|nr:peptide-methionine (S)-S-oxide reductase MsrA [Tepidisphaeraceae bacterium]
MNELTATFGAGCFWGVESTFRKINGVTDVKVGYEGGTLENPSYQDVCTDETGHVEVVQVIFDPAKVSYEKLLEVFFENHDPTTLDRQGADVGTQYRSVIFYRTTEQERLAEAEKRRRDQSGEYVAPIVTAIEPAQTFYPAEEYHQRYFEKQGVNYSCHTGNGKKRRVAAR